jgi:predicted RNA-binding protein associated with RNAse of E/G family
MPTITEIKRNPGKPDQTFVCDLVRHDGDRIVISYVSDRSYSVQDIFVPPGTRTLAYYQEDLPYILWRMTGPEGQLVGYYVHLCDRVQITEDTVEYRDLMLDVWFFPDGAHRLLDEDELDEVVGAGILDETTAAAVRRNATSVIESFPDIRNMIDAHL